MADEVQVRAALQIRKYDASGTILLIDYQSRPTFFTADMDGTVGPTPGSFLASIHGTVVDLSQLTAYGGMVLFMNQDPDNYVTFGPYDTLTGEFYDYEDLLPGEFFHHRLAANFSKEEVTGTSAGTGTVQLMVKARVASCQVMVMAFDP